MIFDKNISNDVSLSKVLDTFIIDNENPTIVISFLKTHDNNFLEILKYSLYSNRLFQLDFFLKCNDNSREYIISKLKNISIEDAALLTWQVLRSNSGKVQNIKYKFRNELNWILKNGPRRPYSRNHEKYIHELDDLIFKYAITDSIADIPCEIDNSRLSHYFKYLSYSLFQKRLLQYDFFSNFDYISKYFFIHNTIDNCCNKNAIKAFALQLLDSNDDVEVKKECFARLRTVFYETDLLDNKVLEFIRQCKSFSEMLLKMSIFNIDVTQLIVLYLLLYNPMWLLEWKKYNEIELNSILNIADLIENLFNQKHFEA